MYIEKTIYKLKKLKVALKKKNQKKKTLEN